MSHQKWEYASIVWVEVVEKITKTDPRYQRLSPERRREWDAQDWKFDWWKQQTLYVWLPGATKADERVSWETGDDESRVTFLDVLNELGAEGWEVVSNNVRNSAMGRSYGRDTTSFPTRIHTLLKRPIDE